jgi:hypothetical protein
MLVDGYAGTVSGMNFTIAALQGRTGEVDDELDHAIRLARAVGDPARLRPHAACGELQQLGLHSTKTCTSLTGAAMSDEAEDRRPAAPPKCHACGETTYTPDPRHYEPFGEGAGS